MSLCKLSGCGKRHLALGYCASHYAKFRKYGDPFYGKTHWRLIDFARGVATNDTDECIVWPFALGTDGYGKVRWQGKERGAHRVVCEMAHGPSPSPKHEAAHSCGKGHLGCVSPRHLRWATHKENHADRAAHGTNNAGETCGSAKLTDDAVRTIRASAGQTQIALARQFGVTDGTIRKILKRETWRHI